MVATHPLTSGIIHGQGSSMIGTGENKVCKLINSFAYEISTTGYFVYMSIGFTLLLHMPIFLYANLLRFAAIYIIYKFTGFAVQLYFFYKSIGFALLVHISFFKTVYLLRFAAVYLIP
jgi:hypothetical protein